MTLAGLDNPGLARYGTFLRFQPNRLERAGLSLELALMHEEWSEWQIGENRFLAMLNFQPLSKFGLGLGGAWRSPVMKNYHSPFIWRSEIEELNLAYRLWWRFLCRSGGNAAIFLANADRFSFHNPQQLPFGVQGALTLKRTAFTGSIGSAVNGLSGMLLSLSELELHLGVSRDF